MTQPCQKGLSSTDFCWGGGLPTTGVAREGNSQSGTAGQAQCATRMELGTTSPLRGRKSTATCGQAGTVIGGTRDVVRERLCHPGGGKRSILLLQRLGNFADPRVTYTHTSPWGCDYLRITMCHKGVRQLGETFLFLTRYWRYRDLGKCRHQTALDRGLECALI